ncbi:MBL fold metallo-hydrolase [Variovorax sp. efr-133-TYG-130]|uniref:MBL fold metallo-hydrolase n=1 Tax=Variovorax sp. efr-133-TYG-130 TaxID=3040327 RepID=UPI00255770A1|nr:MBL fold metallo-hydrolase [Variovorax sp. efr-133-TYG-130]
MTRLRHVAAALCAGGLLAACSTPPNPYYDASRRHHRPDGFQDNYVEFKPKNFFTDVLLGWQIPSWFKGLPPAPEAPPPVVAPDLAFIVSNTGAQARPAATFIGHATVLVQVPTANGSLNVLTDPVFGERASPVSFVGPKRFQPPGVALKDLPRIDLVLISHNHYDHLDEASVKALNAQAGGPPLFVVPLGIKPWLAERGVTNAVELDWWDSVTLPATPSAQALVQRNGAGIDAGANSDAVQVFLTPAQHWSARGLGDRMKTLWGGFALLSPKLHVFYSGDTGYSKDFADIQARLAPRQADAQGGGFDLALLPVGAYEPRWFMKDQHVNPDESVRIHRELHARRSLGVHWGTFSLTDEALDQPPKDLAAARKAQGVADDAFFTLAIGETRKLPARQATP